MGDHPLNLTITHQLRPYESQQCYGTRLTFLPKLNANLLFVYTTAYYYRPKRVSYIMLSDRSTHEDYPNNCCSK